MARHPAEVCARANFTRRIKSAIRSYFMSEKHSVQLFGSDATGMGLPTSDIDLMIIAPGFQDSNPYKVKERKIEALYELEEHFRNMQIPVSMTVRREAHIPILEMENLESGLEMDLSFGEPHVVRALEVVRQWKLKHGPHKLSTMVLLLKHALNIRKLGLGSATMPYQVFEYQEPMTKNLAAD
jgi:DNA polymerase sigma